MRVTRVQHYSSINGPILSRIGGMRRFLGPYTRTSKLHQIQDTVCAIPDSRKSQESVGWT